MVNLTRRIAVLLVMALSVGMGLMFAQTDRGSITGTITDSSGARVAGASINLTATQTGVTSNAKSNTDGVYNFLFLPIGQYAISVEHPGFKKYDQQGITLSVGQTLGIDIVLQVGNATTETINITGEAPQLESETTNVATTATSTLVQDLPLIGNNEMRNPGFFMVLDSTVSSRGAAFGGGGGFNDRSLSTTVAGAPSASAEFHVDGAIIANGEGLHADFRLIGFPQDAVREFSVNTIGLPAELGHTGGGITSFTIKSGTNQFHGTGYEYLRNNVLDARGRFNSSVAPLKQNEFGATFGGPIKKDKIFIFGWYDGFRIRGAASNSLATVPYAAEKNGDFSNFTAENSAGQFVPVNIYNPYSNDGAATARTQFPGNVINIPFDPVGAAYNPLYPDPSGPNAGAQYNNYILAGANATSQNEYGAKGDVQLNSKNRLSVTFTYSTENQAASPTPFAGPLSEASPSVNVLPGGRLNYDYVITPSVVNHVTLAFDRWQSGNLAVNQVAGGWPAKLGYGGLPFTDGAIPIINGFDGVGQFGGAGGNPSTNNQNNTGVYESLSWIKGKHSLKFGVDWLRTSSNAISTGRASGYLFTSTNFTGNPADPNYGTDLTGSGFASFLLGQMDSGATSLYFAPEDGTRGGYWAGYAQDDWKISHRLTANLGVRWDMYEPSVEVHNHNAWMSPTLVNPFAGGRLGAAAFANPTERAGTFADKHDLSPRIGLAYQLNNKTVVRASYGILFGAGGDIGTATYNFLQGYTLVNSIANSNNDDSATWVMGNGWPASKFPDSLSLSPGYGVGSGIQRLDPTDSKPPYMQSRVLQIERQLPSNMVFKIAYIGNQGTRLQSRIDVDNEMPPWDMSLTVPNGEGGILPAFLQPLNSPAVQALPIVASMPIDPVTGLHVPYTGTPQNPAGFYGNFAPTTQLGQALLPYPQYLKGGMRRLYEGDGTSDYNALKVDLDKRMSNGLTLLVSYTWSKTLTDAASNFDEFSGYDQNSYDARAQKSLSINDYPQNLVVTYSYELPFGPGKKFASTGGAIGKIVGGWKVAGVQNYQVGPPQIFTQPCYTQGYEGNGDNGGGFNCRPNILAGVPIANPARGQKGYDPTITSLVNPAAFQLTPNPITQPGLAYQSYFGDAPSLLGGAGRRLNYYEEDISIIKKTQVTERVNVEFHADFLNIFNRTILGWGTGGDMYGSSLGNQIGGGVFGVVNNQTNYPREIQFGLKINY